MLFIESRTAPAHVEGPARLALLEALQDRGLTPLIRTSRLYGFEQALFGRERAAELERLVASWSEAEGDAPYVRGDLFCFEDFAHFLIFGDGEDEPLLRAGIVYGPETDEPARKLDAFCRNVQEALEATTRTGAAVSQAEAGTTRRLDWRATEERAAEHLRQFAGAQGESRPAEGQARGAEAPERARAVELLEEATARQFLRRLCEAHADGRVAEMLAPVGAHDAASESLVARLASAGLVRREVLVSCRKGGHALFRLPSSDALAIMTASHAVCSECGAAVADERAEELVTPTPAATSMLKDGAWLLGRLRAALIELGIPQERLATRAATSETEAQVLASFCGEQFLFVVRDGDFTAAHVRRALETEAALNASHLVVVTTGKLHEEARARLREHARRRSRAGREIEVILVESVETAVAELRHALDRVSQRALTRELYALDTSLGFSVGYVLATRFRLMQKAGALTDLAASAAGALVGSLPEI